MQNNFVDKIRNAGIVGAGGAGFPTYVKASSKADIVIINAAECEPLLRKDQIILQNFPQIVIEGALKLTESVGAERCFIGIKRKHENIITILKRHLKDINNISIYELGDFYPAGDEFCLVYEITGRVIPPGQIPLSVGCVVNNVETIYNVAIAEKTPVIEKFFTVTGAVKKPATYKLPIGVSWREAIELSGGVTVKDPVVIDGGPMMGSVSTNLDTPITKTSAGIIVLDKTHPLIKKKTQGITQFSKIGRSACDQCSFCTEFCPRYLLGHMINPHKVMRSLLFSPSDSLYHSEFALACCECSLCSLYSCSEGLNPKEVCVESKKRLRDLGMTIKDSSVLKLSKNKSHPVREYRKVPGKKLINRLGLSDYDKPAPFVDVSFKPKTVRLFLSQHIGRPAVPCVKVGTIVKKGDIVADVNPSDLGCPIHASIDGVVTEINSKYIKIED